MDHLRREHRASSSRTQQLKIELNLAFFTYIIVLIYIWLILGENTELVAVEHSSGRENLIFRPRTVGALDMGGASMQVMDGQTDKRNF